MKITLYFALNLVRQFHFDIQTKAGTSLRERSTCKQQKLIFKIAFSNASINNSEGPSLQ